MRLIFCVFVPFICERNETELKEKKTELEIDIGTNTPFCDWTTYFARFYGKKEEKWDFVLAALFAIFLQFC